MIRPGDDRGKVTIFVAIIAPAWIGMLALIIVGGGRIRALQRADNVAAEAARTAGQAIDRAAAVQGGAKTIDPDLAAAAAQSYLASVGATGTVTVAATGDAVTVRATITYRNPSGLELFGGATWRATGEATGTLVIR
jgi:Flp pilus assembly protein TadG